MTSVEWSVASEPLPGEEVTGDRGVVAFADARALVAAIDGVGHGGEAAAAADQAGRILKQSLSQDLVSAVRECHRALRSTRGVVLSVASFDSAGDEMTWLGVGNVEARLLRGAQAAPVSESLLLHPGIVGHELSRLAPQTTNVTRGDVLILATDGIRHRFADSLVPSGSCREIADRILKQSASGQDDALVLAARYLGSG